MKKITLLLSLFLLNIPSSFAQTCTCSEAPSLHLEIIDFYPNPADGEEEWIEIKNNDEFSIDLSNYTLEDETAKPWTLSGLLNSGESKKIEGFSFQLNNGGDSVTLKTIEGELIDTISYTSSSSGVSWLENQNANQDSQAEESSQENENSEETENTLSTPEKWPIFSEALPNPEGSDSTEEWIELYNPYSEELTLAGLWLDDEEGGSSPFALEDSIAPESYLLISIEDSKLTLNNSTDSIRLLGVNDEILWEVTYEGSSEGNSYARFNENYEWTSEPTPGSENEYGGEGSSEESDYQNGDLSEDIDITEVYPNPEGPDAEEEWIEITNGGEEAVNLGNWTVDDGEGGSKAYTFPDSTIIEPGETIILYRKDSKIALNNSNETVQLADYSGEIMDEIHYEKSEEGKSYSKIEIEETQNLQASTSGLGTKVFSTWQWITPSPGVINPAWKQFKGQVIEFDGAILTLFDGVSNWSFRGEDQSMSELIFQPGNTVLIQAAFNNGLYNITHSELLESAPQQTPKTLPWNLITTLLLVVSWAGYELYRKRKKTLNNYS